MWTPDITLKSGDRLPTVSTTLKDGSGAAIDLTGYSQARFIVAAATGTTPEVNSTVSAASTAGVISYAWSTGDLDLTAGHYYWEVKLKDGTGRWVTIPNGGYGTLEVVTALSTA